MNKFLSVLLAAMLLTVAFLPAAASPPEPDYYSVSQSGPCWLPNGEARPTSALMLKKNFTWEAPLQFVGTCWGQLPKDAPRPKETIKLTYAETGRLCEVKYQGSTFRTIDYGATVHPNGAAEITCRVDLD